MRCLLLLLLALPASATADPRPNIVWIFTEDMNDWMGCYGDKTVPTPNIDMLAEEGMRFERAYMPAGVCSPTRTAIALGCMQTSLGMHNHVSSHNRSPGAVVKVPEEYKTVYRQLRDSGYYAISEGPKNSFNFAWPTQSEQIAKVSRSGVGASAYFTSDRKELLYDLNIRPFAPSGPVWKDSPKDKPLFMQFYLRGGKNTGDYKGATYLDGEKIYPYTNPWETDKTERNKATYTDASKVEVMPYYPDIPTIRSEIAHHYDCIRQTDDEVGQIVEMLKKDGLYKNTVFFFWADHGMRLYRHKQWLYEGGIRVPLIICGPGIEEGVVRKDLVSGIDITATTLALSQTPTPDWMEGKNLLADDFRRDYVISARDRCDFTIERVRAVTTTRFKYLRNFMTDRPFMQPQYRDGSDYVEDARAYYNAGKMNAAQSFPWSPTRVPEELYDLENDPHEINNLAHDRAYASTLQKHRQILENWIKETNDKGQYPETVTALRGVLKQWSDRAVNPEYDKAR
jgi:N-sulfoglucosamine sulfohydrolase